MKKLILLFISILLIQNVSIAKDTLFFNFPNEGWHKVASPDGVETKKCFVPHEQTTENHVEMLIFYEKVLKNKGISPMNVLHKQLGKDRLNYFDIEPEYIKQNLDDAMITWCSKAKGVCTITRAFQGLDGVVVVSYINKMPHYSQNMFGQWSNILSSVKIYDSKIDKNVTDKNKIEL